MSATIMPPTPEVEACIQLLEEVLQRYLKTRPTSRRSPTHEVDHEAHRLMMLILRHTESVITLAKDDLVLWPSAMVLARSALDTAASIVWTMEPQLQLDREGRWMSKLKEYRSKVDRLGQLLKAKGHTLAWLDAEAKDLESKYNKKLGEFPMDYKFIKMRDVHVDEILASIMIPEHYAYYVLGSQFTHGGMMSTEIYRWEVCGDNTLVDHVTPNMWCFPFYVCWHSIALAWDCILAKTGGDRLAFRDSHIEDRILAALDRLRTAPDTNP